MKRSFIREILEHTNSDTISFAGGLPDENLFPMQELKESFAKSLEDSNSLQYSTSSGILPLKKIIANFYTKEGFFTTADNILITSGSQQALDIISRFNSGKSIATQKPSYLGALNLFELNNIKVNKFSIQKGKTNLYELKRVAMISDLIYLIPDFQNPTGATIPIKQREEIAQICQEYGTILIEDAPYSKLYFKEPINSISSFIQESSFHLGSFSKVLAPALRVGWIRASKELLEPLIAYKEAMDLHTNSLSQQAIYHFLKKPESFDKHLEKLRANYKAKMQYFCKMLDKDLPTFNYIKPKGGMFFYGDFGGVDAKEILKQTLKKGVIFVPGIEFGGKADEVRFNFTHSTFEELAKGIEIIAKVLYNTKKR